MNWSGISEQSLWGKILRIPLALFPKNMCIPIWQGRLKGKKWIVGSSTHGCWLGTYEFAEQHLFENRIKPGSIVFDIGGHVGFYTLLASELVGPQGKVFTFEPAPRNIAYLKKHLAINHILNVTVIEAAVSNVMGISPFEEGPNYSMGHINTKRGSFSVRTVKLDTLVYSHELPIPHYIKMDIEGAEVMALEGAKMVLAHTHPTIFLSTHGTAVHELCCTLLRSWGYHLQSMDGKTINQTSELLATLVSQ